MPRLAFLLALLSCAISAFAFDFTVIVGRDEVTGELGVGFAPGRTVTRDTSDRIVFRINSGTHRVVQTSFANPCSPANAGFDTQTVNVANGTAGATAGPSFPFQPTNTSIPYYFADIGPAVNQSGTFCQQGAVFCLNTDETQSTSSCTAFRQAALLLGRDSGVTTSSRPPYTSSTSTSSTPSSTRVSSMTNAAPAASSSRPASGAGKVAPGGGGVLAGLLGLVALL